MENTIQSIWERIEKWLHVNAPEILHKLPSGATESEIKDIEKQLNIELPHAVRESYLIHDGSNNMALLDFGELRSLDSMLDEWDMQVELWEDGDNDDSAAPPAGVQKSWFNLQWIPFADDWCGNSLCIDLAPSSEGNIGQIIEWNHTCGPRTVISQSFHSWLSGFAVELENDLYAVKTNKIGDQYLEKI